MRRASLILALGLVPLALAAPVSDAKASRTRTPVHMKAPSPANATVAGFRLNLVKAGPASFALARVAASLPRNVSIYAVVGKQRRSDRVQGVLVAVNRATAVTAGATAAKRLTVNLRHAALPKGYRLRLRVAQTGNVLGRHHPFRCASYFKQSDLAGAQRLGGPGLPNITLGTVIQAACSAARGGGPFATLGEFRAALNAPSGALGFVRSTQVGDQVDGTATFNYETRALAVRADPKHRFTGCAFAAGTCTISSTAGHTNDYALFTLSAPAAAGTQLPIVLALSPNPTPALPFRFFGFDAGNHRLGPLLTSGPQ